jgi:threonine/homoserine/homoserine lactone efflux protein
MALGVYLAFVVATIVLIIIPGPNVGLIVANSIAHGTRYGLMTVAGTSAAMVIQLAVAMIGMTTVLTSLAYAFEWLRWIGVAYLLFLALSAWRAPAVDLTRTPAQPRSMAAIFLRGFLVSLTNPKTLLFYGVFLPQFVDRGGNVVAQLLLLSVTFLVLAVVFDGLWAILSARARGLLAANGAARNRLAAGFYLCAGIGLALARRP